MFIKHCWCVAAWDIEVPADGSLTRTITNIPVVFWRDSAGTVVPLEDRCCHRGALLSKNRREGDCLRFMYCGLKFDRSRRHPANQPVAQQFSARPGCCRLFLHRWRHRHDAHPEHGSLV